MVEHDRIFGEFYSLMTFEGVSEKLSTEDLEVLKAGLHKNEEEHTEEVEEEHTQEVSKAKRTKLELSKQREAA